MSKVSKRRPQRKASRAKHSCGTMLPRLTWAPKFGDAQWVKVYKLEVDREVQLEELMGGNAVVPEGPQQAETDRPDVEHARDRYACRGSRRRGRPPCH